MRCESMNKKGEQCSFSNIKSNARSIACDLYSSREFAIKLVVANSHLLLRDHGLPKKEYTVQSAYIDIGWKQTFMPIYENIVIEK